MRESRDGLADEVLMMATHSGVFKLTGIQKGRESTVVLGF